MSGAQPPEGRCAVRGIPSLWLVTDRALCPLDRLPAVVEAVLSGGVDGVQLREKDVPSAELLAAARSLRSVTRGRAALYVNGHVDVALAAGADGIHLGEGVAPTADEVRRRSGAGFGVGRAAHSPAAAIAAEREGVDVIVLGTIYPSRSHPEGVASGPALVRCVARQVRTPIVAIGGLTSANAATVVEAGAHGVAVISALLAAPDPEAAARSLRAAVDAGRQRR